MKLLLFSDVHCNREICLDLVKRSADVDVVVVAGDLANMRRGLDETIEVLAGITRPTILVPGNSESREELENACAGWPSAHILHGSGTRVGECEFYGVGGGIPVTPFGSWSYDFDEDQATKLLQDCPPGCILVTHSPPQGAGDLASNGAHYGSVAIREAIVEKQPLLAVCGHIHEAAGKAEKIGRTSVINAGPHGIVWEL